MAIRLGMDAKFYYGASGTSASNELTNIRNVTLSLSKGEADVTTRGNAGWRATVGTLKEGSMEFEMIWDTDDPGFNAMQNSFITDEPIALRALDQENGTGLDADCSITNFTRNEQLEEAITVSVTAKPTYSTRSPVWQVPSSP